MSAKNISLEFYPQTITNVLLDDPRVPHNEVTKVRDTLGKEETRLWTCRPRHSQAQTCLLTAPINLISVSQSPPRNFVKKIESKLPRIEMTKLYESLGERETRQWLSSTLNVISSEYEDSINVEKNVQARSLSDLPLPATSGASGSSRRSHRVGFKLKSRERMYFDRHKIIKPHTHSSAISTIPSHQTPKRQTSMRSPIKQHLPSLENMKKKKEAVGKIHQFIKDWRLDTALEREKCHVRLNQRQLTEMRLQDQRALSLDAMCRRILEHKSTAKILIIGAGLAGVSAAHKLLTLKFNDLIILEALDRVGGRVHTIANATKPGSVMEMGAPGLHHFKPWNTVYSLAIENELVTAPLHRVESETILVHNCRGTTFSPENRKRARLLSQEIECSVGVVKQLNDKSQNTKINLSYRDYIREKTRRAYKKMSVLTRGENEQADLSSQMGCFIQEGLFRLGNSNGTVASQHLSSIRDSSRLLRLPNGMSSLLSPLMKHFKKETVQYKCQVESIDWSSAHVDDLRKGRDLMVKVTCKNGRVFTAHHVIVTLPLGVLKKHGRALFKPQLPESKLRAIENLGFASVSRVFARFAEPFWLESLKFIWTDDIDNNDDPCCKDALIFTVRADDTAIEVTTAGTYLDDVCDSYLKKLLSGILSSFYQKEIPDPIKITRARWSTNPYFEGTHPYMGQVSSQSDVAELAAPIYFLDTPLVLFAGDATYKNYTCLTHAARASGLREAIRLNSFYNELHKYKNKN